MWILDFIKWQKIDVIRWENPEEYLLIKKFERPLDEIKDNATLIVDPGQAAIFVHNGKIEAIQLESWKWTLDTENVPFITSFKNIMRGLESPDKAAIYFVKVTEILNQKWGTKNPIKYMDPEYNFPVKLRAFWNISFKIDNLENLWINFIWTRNEVTVDEIRNLIVDRLLWDITSDFAWMWITYTQIDSKRAQIAKEFESKVNSEISELWLKVTDFRIEDTNFDEETEKLIMKISQQTATAKAMNQLGDVNAKAMDTYKTTKQLDILQEAAWNEWSMWWMMWTFVWMNMWQQIAWMSNSSWASSDDAELKLAKLKSMLDKWLISQQEYDEKKKDILSNM